MRILVEGQSRAEMVDCIQSEPYLFARVEEIEVPTYNKSHSRVQALLRQAHGAYEQFVDLAAKNLQDGLLQVISSDDAGFVADFIGQNSSIPYPDKQKLLEQAHPVKRLELAVKLLAKELEILELENEISEKVQQNVNKGQRDYYLREQMHGDPRGARRRGRRSRQRGLSGEDPRVDAPRGDGGEAFKGGAAACQAAAELRRGRRHPELSGPRAGASVEQADKRAAGREGSGKNSR